MKKYFRKNVTIKYLLHTDAKKQYQLILAPQKTPTHKKNRADSHLKVSSERINYEKSTLV